MEHCKQIFKIEFYKNNIYVQQDMDSSTQLWRKETYIIC